MSYDCREYESVDEKSLSYAMSRKTKKKIQAVKSKPFTAWIFFCSFSGHRLR